MRWLPAGLTAFFVVVLSILSARDGVRANGLVQREIHGRVASVDANAGRLVVLREDRGRTMRISLTTEPGAGVLSCGEDGVGLDQVKRGMVVRVFYEAVGPEGVANLIAIERGR
jgi:hypothetical protein